MGVVVNVTCVSCGMSWNVVPLSLDPEPNRDAVVVPEISSSCSKPDLQWFPVSFQVGPRYNTYDVPNDCFCNWEIKPFFFFFSWDNISCHTSLFAIYNLHAQRRKNENKRFIIIVITIYLSQSSSVKKRPTFLHSNVKGWNHLSV